MTESISQLALLDALLRGWDTLRMLMGPAQPGVDRHLAAIAARLSAASSSDEISLILDNLLDLAENTPAEEHLRRLIASSRLDEAAEQRVREGAPSPAERDEDASRIEEEAMRAGRALGRALSTTSNALAVPVFFATNRRPQAEKPAEGPFGGEPAQELSFGLAHVTIPVAAHKMGRLETPRWWRLFGASPDARRHVLLQGTESLSQAEFQHRLGLAVREEPSGDLLVFMHGYNVTFEDAARRAAQLSHDLKLRGAVALFSWPSLGSAAAYFADEERAALSAERLSAFLRTLEGGPWRKVHLMAHSMGNRVLVLGLADHPRPQLPLGQVVFVAADVYVEVFRQKYPRMAEGGTRATSYVSRTDLALFLSSLLHRADRIGITRGEPFVIEGMETVDATAVDTSLLGHSYFGSERSVLTDLGFLIREGLPADRRGLERRPGRDCWDFPA